MINFYLMGFVVGLGLLAFAFFCQWQAERWYRQQVQRRIVENEAREHAMYDRLHEAISDWHKWSQDLIESCYAIARELEKVHGLAAESARESEAQDDKRLPQ